MLGLVSALVHFAGLMVQSGFRLRAQFDSDENYVPPGDWNGKFQDLWVFEYIRCVSRHAAADYAAGRTSN
jgi:hypothetical protein